MNEIMNLIGEVLNDPNAKSLWDANVILFDAPTIVYITIPKKRTLYNLFDSGAIEMTVMAAAKEYGIDSVPAYEAIKYPEILRKNMKIPDEEDIVIGIALGYKDDENILNKIHPKKLTLDEACHFYE
jgi:nitroreductase